MAAQIKSNTVKLKPKEDGSSSSKGKEIPLSVNKKKIESSNKNTFILKHNSIASVSKVEVKGKSVASSSKTTSKTTTVKTKAQKKIYTLPGQRYDPPEEREPLRIFYESLSKQIPKSEMAEFWLMEHGMLSPERAKKAYERKQKRQQQQRMGTPIKSPTKQRTESLQKLPTSKNGELLSKKRSLSYDDDDDDDFIMKPKKANR